MQHSDIQALSPLQSKMLGFGPAYSRGACRGCEHEHEDKNICRTYKDCAIHLPTIMTDEESRNRRFNTPNKPYYRCKFPGCVGTVYSGAYCGRHSQIVSMRKQRYKYLFGGALPPDEYIHLPQTKYSKKRTLVHVFIEKYGTHPTRYKK